jgi:hypothetical protein
MRGMVLATLLAAALPQTPASGITVRFHHLHLRDSPPEFRIGFYERLFDRDVTRRVTVGGVAGLQTGSRLILVSPGQGVKELPSALWHFGWGKATLGENYLAHARNEVAWEAPLPPEDLHVHLRSLAPARAAMWYRDTLGAHIELPPLPRRREPALPAPEHRMPEALIAVGGLPLLVYRTEGPLLSSIGQRIDHLAFVCADLPVTLALLEARGVAVISGPKTSEGIRSAMIAGPDQIPIELLEAAP